MSDRFDEQRNAEIYDCVFLRLSEEEQAELNEELLFYSERARQRNYGMINYIGEFLKDFRVEIKR